MKQRFSGRRSAITQPGGKKEKKRAEKKIREKTKNTSSLDNGSRCYLNLGPVKDLTKMGPVLFLVQVELTDGVQGLPRQASHSVHPHLCHQHALPKQLFCYALVSVCPGLCSMN